MFITNPSKSKIDRLRELKQLYEDGTINEAEMNAEKTIILSQDETSADQTHQKEKQSGKLHINSNGKIKWILVAVGVIIIAIVVWLLVKPTDDSNPIESDTTEAEALWAEQEMVETDDEDVPDEEEYNMFEGMEQIPSEEEFRDNPEERNYDNNGRILSQPKPDVQAEFPGGDAALSQWISEQASKVNINKSGRVIVEFIVDQNGKVKEVKVVRGRDPQLDREAVKIIKRLPDFIPATQKGSIVESKIVVPVLFKEN